MTKMRKLAKTITTILFVALLASTLLFSGQQSYQLENTSLKKERSVSKQGFYLEPLNKELGIDFVHSAPDLDPKIKHIERQIASLGASVSICDYDNDGWNDIYFTNSRAGTENALYRNLKNGMFENVAPQLGIASVNNKETGVSMGAVWGDYDNDGFEDLLLYKWGQPELFKNDSGKNFIRVTEESGLPKWVNANSAIWFDLDNDGLLDIFLGSYYREELNLADLNTTKIMPESFKYANNGGRNYLLKNIGNGKFTDVTTEYGLSSTKWTLAAGAFDINGDNFPELIVANDYSVEEFYMNVEGKKFEERGRQTGMGHIPKSGMNVSFGDVDNTGTPGVYVTNITEEGVLIQGNNFWKPKDPQGDIRFANLSQLLGIENAGWSYCGQFGDLNNDGYLDLYVANGYISAKKGTSYWYDYTKITGGNQAIISDAANWPDMKDKSQSGYQQNKIWMNSSEGFFEDVSDKVSTIETSDSRAVAMADLWNKGVLDVIVANQNGAPLIYRNEVINTNHWIDFDLRGTITNASAIGAKILLEWDGKQQTQVVTGGIGFSSQNQHRIHFGIGENKAIDRVTIHWPSGRTTTIDSPAIDTLHVIVENKETN